MHAFVFYYSVDFFCKCNCWKVFIENKEYQSSAMWAGDRKLIFASLLPNTSKLSDKVELQNVCVHHLIFLYLKGVYKKRVCTY